MRVLAICILTYVAFALRTVLPLVGAWGHSLPRLDLALLLVIVCRSGGTTALLTAAGWGLVSDALSGGALGVDMLSFVLVTYGTLLARAKGWMQVPLVSSAVAGAAVSAITIASAFLRLGVDQPAASPTDLLVTAGGPALTTAILVFVVCELWIWIVGRPAGGPRSSLAPVDNRWHMLTE